MRYLQSWARQFIVCLSSFMPFELFFFFFSGVYQNKLSNIFLPNYMQMDFQNFWLKVVALTAHWAHPSGLNLISRRKHQTLQWISKANWPASFHSAITKGQHKMNQGGRGNLITFCFDTGLSFLFVGLWWGERIGVNLPISTCTFVCPLWAQYWPETSSWLSLLEALSGLTRVLLHCFLLLAAHLHLHEFSH